ncbi:MAG: hypothetical protein M0T86_01775 [Betaproteobacteria bacterium]|nr:hypothetical protein [Betaproteobacteria bacterium]
MMNHSSFIHPACLLRNLAYSALSAMLFLAVSQSASGQDACPDHAHVSRVEVTGNVKTTHCACDTGYKNLDGQCRMPSKLNPNQDPDVERGLDKAQSDAYTHQIEDCIKRREANMTLMEKAEKQDEIIHGCTDDVANVAGVRG